MKSKKTATVIVLMAVLSICICGCGTGKYQEVKASSHAVKEYNSAIKQYNRMALAFTDLARFVDNSVDSPEGFDKAFWDKYQSKKEKVLGCMDSMKDFTFQHKDMDVVSIHIKALMDSLGQYMQYVDAFGDGNGRIGKEEFIDRHKELYENILDQSSDIVRVFDEIYDKAIVNG